jgi:hypothetical protein
VVDKSTSQPDPDEDSDVFAIDDTMGRLIAQRDEELKKEMLSIAEKFDARKSYGDAQIEDTVNRTFDPRLSDRHHLELLKKRSVLVTDSLLQLDKISRQALAYGRVNARHQDQMRFEINQALGGVSRTMAQMNKSIETVAKRALRADRRVSPFTVTILSGCAVMVVCLFLRMDEKVSLAITTGFVAIVFEVQRRMGTVKVNEDGQDPPTPPPPNPGKT